jgi:hypothetical protein
MRLTDIPDSSNLDLENMSSPIDWSLKNMLSLIFWGMAAMYGVKSHLGLTPNMIVWPKVLGSGIVAKPKMLGFNNPHQTQANNK